MGNKEPYRVTVELSEIELALLYHTVTGETGEHRQVFWEEGGRREPHYFHPRWLENKVFGQIAQERPEWLPVMTETAGKLSLWK